MSTVRTPLELQGTYPPDKLTQLFAHFMATVFDVKEKVDRNHSQYLQMAMLFFAGADCTFRSMMDATSEPNEDIASEHIGKIEDELAKILQNLALGIPPKT